MIWGRVVSHAAMQRCHAKCFGAGSRNGCILDVIERVELPDGLASWRPTNCFDVARECVGQLRCAGLNIGGFGASHCGSPRSCSRRIRSETPKTNPNRATSCPDGGNAGNTAPDAATGTTPWIDTGVLLIPTLRRGFRCKPVQPVRFSQGNCPDGTRRQAASECGVPRPFGCAQWYPRATSGAQHDQSSRPGASRRRGAAWSRARCGAAQRLSLRGVQCGGVLWAPAWRRVILVPGSRLEANLGSVALSKPTTTEFPPNPVFLRAIRVFA